MAEGMMVMSQDLIGNKLKMIEESRKYMHQLVDAQYDEFVRQTQGLDADESETEEEIFAPQMSM